MSLVQDHHHAHTSLHNTTEIQEATALFRIWMRGDRELIFTGRKQNANKCARILPLFQNFVDKHASFFVDKFAYTHLVIHAMSCVDGCVYANDLPIDLDPRVVSQSVRALKS